MFLYRSEQLAHVDALPTPTGGLFWSKVRANLHTSKTNGSTHLSLAMLQSDLTDWESRDVNIYITLLPVFGSTHAAKHFQKRKKATNIKRYDTVRWLPQAMPPALDLNFKVKALSNL